MEPAAGPGLIFKTIPVVFSRIPGGFVLAIIFFLLLSFAALTSAISLLEAQVAYLIDERGWGRKRATCFLAGLAFIVGLPTALSFNTLSDWTIIGERTFFDSADLLTSNYLLPLSGLLISIYVGWFWSGSEEKEELVAGGSGWVYPLWHFLIRYVSPVAIAIVLFYKVQETGLFAWIRGLF
jgi:neurotransmitter:Na+ symporter, NSS family